MNHKKASNNWLKIIMVIIFTVGVIIALYPFYVEAINNYIDQQRINKVDKTNSELSAQKRKALETRNRRLAENGLHQENNPFAGSSKRTQVSLKKHLIGSISIPKIKANMPLFDTTNAETLNYGATVLQGTSFPLGGKNTHTVIAAHRGLPSRKLFTDLNYVKKGNIFVLTVYKKKLAYKVYKIQVVKPNQTSVLKIIPGKDLATLLTCTPYMINSHRILVTGYRIPYTPKIAKDVNHVNHANNANQLLILIAIILLLLAILGYIIKLIHQGMLRKNRFSLIFYRLSQQGDVVKNTTYALQTRVLRRPIYRNGKKFIVTADNDGKVNFNNLPGGLYHVQEIFPNDKIGCTVGIKKLHQQTAKMYLKDKNRSLFKLYHNDL